MQQRLRTQVHQSSLFRRGIGVDIRRPSLPRPPIPYEVGRSISVRRHRRRRRRWPSDARRRCTPDTSCAVSSTLVRHRGVSRDAHRDGAGNTRRRRRRVDGGMLLTKTETKYHSSSIGLASRVEIFFEKIEGQNNMLLPKEKRKKGFPSNTTSVLFLQMTSDL